MDIAVEADTLEQAERDLSVRVPHGEYVLERRVESEGQVTNIRASGLTLDEAYALAETRLTEGATILGRTDIRPQRTRTIDIEAETEVQATRDALGRSTDGAVVLSTTLKAAGRRGVFGLGHRLPQWQFTVDEPAVVELRVRPRARIVFRTGRRPLTWQELSTAMLSITPTDGVSPSAVALREMWPFQVWFLMLTDGNVDVRQLDAPLEPVAPELVERVREYIERTRLPKMLAVAGGALQADRYPRVAEGRIGKVAAPMSDAAIVQTASCLPRAMVNVHDTQGLGQRAYQAIEHYAALPLVSFCFSIPYLQQVMHTNRMDSVDLRIEIYKGTEVMLLELWDELETGETITDQRVLTKVQSILQPRKPQAQVVLTPDDRAAKATQDSRAKGMFVCLGTRGDQRGLYLVDANGAVSAELARPGPGERIGNFAVSPDARWVAYTCHVTRQDDGNTYPTIRTVAATGGASTDLKEWDAHYRPCYQNPVFSPAGDKMICEFALQHAGNPDLQVLKPHDWGNSLDGGSTGLTIVNPMSIGNHAARFMDDGERIVYFGNFAPEDLLEVCLYDPASATPERFGVAGWRLTAQADGVWRRPRALAVQSEWEQIFFIQGHGRDAERIGVILLADVPPGAYLEVISTIGTAHRRIGALDISRDGRRLCYDGDGVIHIIGADGSGVRKVSPLALKCTGARWSADGTRLAYIGGGKLRVAEADGTGTYATPGGDDLQIDAFEWT